LTDVAAPVSGAGQHDNLCTATAQMPTYMLSGFVHQLLSCSDIHSTIWLKAANDNTMSAQGTAGLDVGQHDLHDQCNKAQTAIMTIAVPVWWQQLGRKLAMLLGTVLYNKESSLCISRLHSGSLQPLQVKVLAAEPGCHSHPPLLACISSAV
jgi:hypothetical protein